MNADRLNYSLSNKKHIFITKELIKNRFSIGQHKCMQAVSENEFIGLKWEHLMFSDGITDVTQYNIPLSLMSKHLFW